MLENFGGRTNYAKRLARVTAYIYEHLDEDIDLARLAEVACLSPWHWHRIYHALHGETVAATVRRLRLQRAAADLANTTLGIEEIARRARYEAVPSFSRAFPGDRLILPESGCTCAILGRSKETSSIAARPTPARSHPIVASPSPSGERRDAGERAGHQSALTLSRHRHASGAGRGD